MSKPLHFVGAAALAAGIAFAVPAQAGAVWSVSIGGPGYAVAAWPAYHPYYRHGHRHHHQWHRAYVPGPMRYAPYAPPLVYAPRVVYRAPMAFAPPVVYPRRVVYSTPVVVRPW